MSGYRVPKARVRSEVRVSNSRFVATLDRVSTMAEAQQFMRAIRAEMPDATHHVYAFRIGHGASISEGLSDDGEPAGTAGPPAMAVVRGSDVGDVALVITRYFGGTKLGTGGLVAAYTKAAQAAFAAAETEKKVERVSCRCEVPYALHEQVRRLLEQVDALIEHEGFGERVVIDFRVARERLDELGQRLADLSAGALSCRVRGTE